MNNNLPVRKEEQQEEDRNKLDKNDKGSINNKNKLNIMTSNTNYNADTLNDEKNKKKPILILINPHSGKGQSVYIFKKSVLPILKSKQIEHEIFITEKNLRVETFLKNKDLNELLLFKAIIVVSGDGLFHEALNSIMQRPDSKQILEHITMGAIPTGSGNGLAYTLLRQSLKKNDNNQQLTLGPIIESMKSDEAIKICCEQAIQDEYSFADLVKITIPSKKSTIWSFLSIGWGLLADIDIDSEWLRKLGELRFTIYGLLRSITSVSYNGKLSYLLSSEQSKKSRAEESDENSENNTDNQRNNDNWTSIEDKFACLYAVHQAYISSETRFAPNSTLTDELMYLTFIRGKLSPSRAVEFMLAIKDGSHDKLSYVNVVPVKSFKFQPLEDSKIVVDGEVIPWTVSDGPILAEIVPKVLKLQWSPTFEI